MRLIPGRHGETVWNVEGREMGQLDSPLTPLGIREAERLARRLSAMKIDAIYSSPLGRAMQTASVIAAACHTEVHPEPELRERNMGIFQGLTQKQIEQRFPEEGKAYAEDQNYAIPNGESGPERAERSIHAFSEIAARHPGSTVVAVTHSGLLRGFLEWVMGITAGHRSRFRRDNASYNAFDFESELWTLVTWNDVSHLEH